MEETKHFCELNAQKFAQAVTGILVIVYILCTVVVLIAPDFAFNLFFRGFFHLLNFDKVASVEISFGSFILGLIQITIYSYIGGLVFAWLHNKYSNKQ